jgi:hypothetical protein
LTRFSRILDFHSNFFFIFLWARTAEHAWAKPLLRSSVNLASVKFQKMKFFCSVQNISHSIAVIMNGWNCLCKRCWTNYDNEGKVFRTEYDY